MSLKQGIKKAPQPDKGSLLSEMFFSWNTKNALKSNPANMIVDALDCQLSLSDDLKFKLQLCLHEAAANALLHGNLDIHDSIDSLEQLAARDDVIHNRINDDTHGKRLLIVTVRHYAAWIEVLVKDQGNGVGQKTKNKNDVFGRGQDLMNTFANYIQYDNATTTLSILFALDS